MIRAVLVVGQARCGVFLLYKNPLVVVAYFVKIAVVYL